MYCLCGCVQCSSNSISVVFVYNFGENFRGNLGCCIQISNTFSILFSKANKAKEKSKINTVKEQLFKVSNMIENTHISCSQSYNTDLDADNEMIKNSNKICFTNFGY